MKLWLKGSVLLAVTLAASAAFAADHRDGPAATGAPESDINDVYSWMSTDNTKLILIQTVGGLDNIDNFSSAVQYAFHVGRGSMDPPVNLIAPPPDTTDIVCEFDSNTAIACYVGTQGDPAIDFVTGDPTPTAGLASANGSFTVHAGKHADPFYFHLAGFNAARGLVVAAVAGGFITGASFEPSGCVQNAIMNTPIQTATGGAITNYGDMLSISDILLGMLNGDVSSDLACANPTACLGSMGPGEFAVDSFATNNTLAIVVEIDKSILLGTGEYFYVNASTHEKP